MNTCTICKSCGTELPTQARFCGTCGCALAPQSPSVAPQPSLPPNQGYPQSNPVSLILGKAGVSYVAQPNADPSRPLQPGRKIAPSGQLSAPPSSISRPLPGYAPRPPLLEDADTASRPDRNGALLWVLLAITIIIITALSAGGLLAYIMTRPHPQPQISLLSSYTADGLPAGANGTILRVQGQKFSSASGITLLLNGRPLPGAPRVISDQDGNFSVILTIPASWSPGRYSLTARDANHYTPKKSAAFAIVAQGEANTPGPNGAPSDDASFTLHIIVQGEDTSTQTQTQDQASSVDSPLSSADPLIVTGNAASTGGSVCKARDNGQTQTYQSTTSTGLPYTQDATFSCTGSYKGGQLSYTETLLSDVVTVNNQGTSYTCHLLTSGVDEQLNGNYTATGFSGSVIYSSFPQSDFACTTGRLPYFYFSLLGGTHDWTATTA